MITQQEFETILNDATKRIDGNIAWREDANRWPACTFRVAVLSSTEHSLEIASRWNPKAGKLSYVLLRRGTGRIYALDLGRLHTNPSGESVGSVHKHRWTDALMDKWAYAPSDITAPWDRPVEVWQEFLNEVTIRHDGELQLPNWQEELSL